MTETPTQLHARRHADRHRTRAGSRRKAVEAATMQALERSDACEDAFSILWWLKRRVQEIRGQA